MDERHQKAILRETFDMVADGYDSKALRFFSLSAEYMAETLDLCGHEHVLDVACGTGHTALAVARSHLNGFVTAVDLSPGMLDQARKKAFSQNVRNIEFLERDMTALAFPENTFDAAICAFGIFFAEDMDAQLLHISSVVKPGGRIMISSFQDNYFHPLRDMMVSRMTGYGVQMPPQTWKQIAHEAGCRDLFARAGLTDIRVEPKNVGYYLENAEQWWEIVWNAGFRRMVRQLKPEDQVRFKREHLHEVEALGTGDGIWLDVGVLYTVGTKPGGNEPCRE